MSNRILRSPSATGKTQVAIESLLTYRGEPDIEQSWVLLPDRYQVAQFRSRLAAAGGALGVQVGTFGTLYRELLQQAKQLVPIASASVVGRLVRSAVQGLSERGELTHYAPIAAKPGFLNAMGDRIAEFKRAQVAPEAVLSYEGPDEESIREIGRIYAAYQQMLRGLGWADPEGLNWLAAEALAQDPALGAYIQLLVVDGFDSFHRSQLTAMRLLAERVPRLIVTLPGDLGQERIAHRRFRASMAQLVEAIPDAKVEHLEGKPHLPVPLAHLEENIFAGSTKPIQPGDAFAMLEARSPRDETREALRWIKTRIRRDGLRPDACALVTPDPERYRPLLREAAQEFGIPLRFTHGDPLANAPGVAALLDLVDLPAANWPRRKLLDTLTSPYFELATFKLNPELASTLEDVSLYGQVVEGWEAWKEALERLSVALEARPPTRDEDEKWPDLPRGERAEALLSSLTAFAERIQPPGQGTTQAWIAWLEDLLDDVDFYGRCETAHDHAAALGLRETLRALVLGESVAGEAEMDYAAFLAELGSVLERAILEPKTDWRQPAVLVLRVLEARGLRFDALGLMGLSEGLFPEVEWEDPFLNDTAREIMGLDPRLGREQGGLFYQAVTRADQALLLTRPYLAEDGAAWEPSPFWEAAQALFKGDPPRVRPDKPRALTEAASSHELLFWAVRKGGLPRNWAQDLIPRWEQLREARQVLAARQARAGESPYEGGLGALSERTGDQYGPKHTWSASRLESYALCPLFFLANSTLSLDPRDPPEPGYDSAQLGSVLHAILEQVYPAASDPTDLDELLRILPGIAREEFERAPEQYGFRPTALWALEQAELLEILNSTISALHEASAGWTPYRYEQMFGIGETPRLRMATAEGEVLVRGFIDRLDKNEDGELRVIDYKSGSSHQSSGDLIRGRRLQLAIYAMGARDALGLGQPVDGFYWQIRAAKAGSLKLGKFKHSDEEREWIGPEGAMELVRGHVERIMRGVRAGAFPPTPPADGCPSYCPAVSWCWRYRAGFW